MILSTDPTKLLRLVLIIVLQMSLAYAASAQSFYLNVTDVTEMNHCGQGEFEFIFGSGETNGAFSHFECERSTGGIVSCPFDPELQVGGLMSFTKEVPIDADIYNNFIGGNPIKVRAVTEQDVRTNWVTMTFSGDYASLPAPAFNQTNFEACAGETITISPNNTSQDLVWSTTPYFFQGDLLNVPGNTYSETVLANTDKTLWVAQRVDDCQSVQGKKELHIKGHSTPALSFDAGQVPQDDFCSTANLDVLMTSHIATYVEWSVEPHIAALFVNMPAAGTINEFTATKFRFDEDFQLRAPSSTLPFTLLPLDVTFTFTPYNSEHCAGSPKSFTTTVNPVLQPPSVCYDVDHLSDGTNRFTLNQVPNDIGLVWEYSNNDMGGPYHPYQSQPLYMNITEDTWFRAKIDQSFHECATTAFTNTVLIRPDGLSNCEGTEGGGSGCEIYGNNPFEIYFSPSDLITIDSENSFEVEVKSHNGEFELNDINVVLGGATSAITGESNQVVERLGKYYINQTLTNNGDDNVDITYSVTVTEKDGCATSQKLLRVTVRLNELCIGYNQNPLEIQSITTVPVSICSGESFTLNASTNIPVDLSTVVLSIPNTNIGRGGLTTNGAATNWSFSEVLTNTTANDITVTAKVSVEDENGCGDDSEEFQITVKPDNATGEMLFDGELEPPAFGLSAGSQTVSITMDAGHHGAPVEIFTRPNGLSSWTSQGQIAINGSLDVTFNQATSIKAETTSTSNCISQLVSSTEVITYSNNAQWMTGFPDNYTVCSGEYVDHTFISNVPGVTIEWVRTILYGDVYNDGSYHEGGSIPTSGYWKDHLRRELENYTESTARVRYTITQYLNGQSILSDAFEVTVRSYNERSAAQATLTKPESICGASSGKVKLVTYSYGQFHWERVDLATYNNYASNIENAPWTYISNPSDSQYVAQSTVFRVVATGNCVETRFGPPTQETMVHVVTNPPPTFANKESMADEIDFSICTGESFNQAIVLSNNYGVYDWSATVLEGSVSLPNSWDRRVIGTRGIAINRTLVNNGDIDAIVEYKIYTRIHECYGDTAVVKVRVSPIVTAGQLIASTYSLCDADSINVTHENAVGSRFIWSRWTPSIGWLELGTDWSSKNFFIDEAAVFKVEAYGDCQDSQHTIAYSDTIHYISPTYLSEAYIYVAQDLSCTSTTLTKIGDDTDTWYWQPDENGLSDTDNSQSKTLTEGALLYLRKKESECWGPIKTVSVSYLDEPATLASDIHRFGAGKAALRAASAPGLSYHWNGPSGFVGISESTVFEDVPLGVSNFSVKAISQEQCASGAFVSVTVTAHPVPRSALNGPQFLNPSQPTSIYLNSSYSNIKWYRSGEEMAGETGTSIDVTQPGAYWARITLPDGTMMDTDPTKVMEWSNDLYTPPAPDGFQPPMASSTAATPGLGSMNYMRVLAPREAIPDGTQVMLDSDPDQVSAITSYTDGLGRQVQSVARGTSFSGKDQVGIAAYDQLGRSTRRYMAYAAASTDGGFQSHPFDEQYDFYDTPGPGIAGTSRPYSQMRYEASPLNRVLETAVAGESWNPGTGWDTPARKTTKYHHRSNYSERDGEIQRYFLDGVMLDSYGSYPNHSLKVTQILDPMNHIVQTFTTKRGQTVLRRAKGENDKWADTYYVYDDLDQLTLILTPEAVEIIGTPDYANSTGIAIIQTDMELEDEPDRSYVYSEDVTITLTDGFHAKATEVDSVFSISPGNVNIVIPTQNLTSYEAFQHLYLFEYDERRRLIRKKVPGADWEIYAYDRWDRLVLSQSGHMRENGLSQYNFIKYDQWNRAVISGVVTLNDPIETIRQTLMAHTIRFESRTGTASIGYTWANTFPASVDVTDIHNVVFFDDYNVPKASNDKFNFKPGEGYTESDKNMNVKGLVTGSFTRILDGEGNWQRSFYYYDNKYRPIFMASKNANKTIDHNYQLYAFRGVVEKSVLIHDALGTTPLQITREYDYDHMDRLLSVTHQLGDIATDKVTLANYEYNELGQVITQNLHQAAGETDYLQRMDLRYHIHGQLTAINDPDNPSANNGRLKDVFALKLDYEQGFESAQFSGHVAGATWYNRSHMEESPAKSTFGYVYDTRQQLRMADYSGADDYTTRVTEYDQNGNIKALERQGKTEVATGMIDQLQYDYLANQLQSVDDQSTMDGGYEDGASSSLELEYDYSGNLTRERNKGVDAVTYNHLNLPTRIELDNSRAIEYIYNGSGTRLRAEYYEGIEMVKKVTYAGQFYYEDDALSQVFTETGRIVNDDNGRVSGAPDGWDGVDYQYMLADHLGNARVVLSSIPERHVTVTATHEDELLADEIKVFDMGIRESNDQLLDHTHLASGNMDYNTYVKVTGQVDEGDGINETIGTMAMLQVQAGDRIDLTAYAKYIQGGSDTNVGATGLIAGLANAFGFNPNSGETGAAFDLFNQANSALTGLMSGDGGTEPDAYLQYLFFDKDFNFTSSQGDGFDLDKVTNTATGAAHQELTLSKTFTEDGYIFVFVSNSSPEIPVYFDDLTIDYTMNPIDQANDYYPFGGLMGSGFERIISKANDFRYQGKEYDKDLQWYDFHARQYDPYLGRFLAADPLMQFSSPYNGMGNNPISIIDPTGMWGSRGESIIGGVENDNDQDDETNALSNGHTADAWEREVAAHYAQFDSWLGGMNSTYGHSLHAANTYGVGNGSYGSAAHQGYASNATFNAQARTIINNATTGYKVQAGDHVVYTYDIHDSFISRQDLQSASILDGNYEFKDVANYGMAISGFVLGSAEGYLKNVRSANIAKGTRTALNEIRTSINPSISRIAKVAKGLGVAGVLFNGTITGAKWYNGQDVTASQVADLAIGVGLIAAGGLAVMSAPVALFAVGAYGVLDAVGAFDGIKSSLGGDTVILQGYRPGN